MGEMKVLFNKFLSRINLVALLLSDLGYRDKKSNSEFRHFTYSRCSPYKFRLIKVKICVLLRKYYSRSNLSALLVTMLGPRNKKMNSEFWKFYILRVLSIRIPTKKDLNLCFVRKISLCNKSDGTFGNCAVVQEQKNVSSEF
jgi:hypothetical protein